MKCPFCIEEKKKSTIFAPSGASRTLMMSHAFYDEDGKYHHHDPNWSTSVFSCSNGHSWVRSVRGGCPHGDYPLEETIKARHDD